MSFSVHLTNRLTDFGATLYIMKKLNVYSLWQTGKQGDEPLCSINAGTSSILITVQG
jgi:hypothetical protein